MFYRIVVAGWAWEREFRSCRAVTASLTDVSDWVNISKGVSRIVADIGILGYRCIGIFDAIIANIAFISDVIGT